MTVPAPQLSSFDVSYGFTLPWEVGKVDNPNDHGGRTKDGVTQWTYDRYRQSHSLPVRDVWLMLDSERDAIYRSSYWEAVNGDGIASICPNMALCVFDGAVNHGVGTSAKLFQRVVLAEADGKIGQATLACFRARLLKAPERLLLTAYLQRRRGIYATLVIRDPSQSVFARGWARRLNSLAARVGCEAIWEV